MNLMGAFFLSLNAASSVGLPEDFSFLTLGINSGATSYPNGRWGGGNGSGVLFAESLTGDGSYRFTVPSGCDICCFGFDDDNSSVGAGGGWDYNIFVNDNGNYWYEHSGSGGWQDTTVGWNVGDVVQLTRIGTSVIFERSTDGGGTFSTIYTFPDPSTGTIYMKMMWYGDGGEANIVCYKNG